jgi:hypothetical protein
MGNEIKNIFNELFQKFYYIKLNEIFVSLFEHGMNSKLKTLKATVDFKAISKVIVSGTPIKDKNLSQK